MKKQRNKIRTNRDYCPVCLESWADCECDQYQNEDDLIRRDDEEIASGLGIY